MAVHKYRSVSEMPDLRPRPALAAENLRIACELSELAFALRPWRLDPGVTKFRSLAEANRHRAIRERRHIERSNREQAPPDS